MFYNFIANCAHNATNAIVPGYNTFTNRTFFTNSKDSIVNGGYAAIKAVLNTGLGLTHIGAAVINGVASFDLQDEQRSASYQNSKAHVTQAAYNFKDALFNVAYTAGNTFKFASNLTYGLGLAGYALATSETTKTVASSVKDKVLSLVSPANITHPENDDSDYVTLSDNSWDDDNDFDLYDSEETMDDFDSGEKVGGLFFTPNPSKRKSSYFEDRNTPSRTMNTRPTVRNI